MSVFEYIKEAQKTFSINHSNWEFFTFIFGVVHFTKNDLFLDFSEIIISILAIINIISYKYHHNNYNIASSVILFLMILMLDILVFTGGLSGTGIYWIYTFPLLAFFLKNLKDAVIWSFFLVFSIIFLYLFSLLNNFPFPYDFVEIRQSLLAYIAVFLVALSYSYVLMKLNNSLLKLSIYDSLTNLYNRKYIYDLLNLEIEKIKRDIMKSLCIVYVDLDNFKQINDKFGHHTGDLILKEVSSIFKKNFRKIDSIGRLGGDEFLFIISDCDKEVINNKFKNLQKLIEEKFKEYNLSMSYGIIKIPEESKDLEISLKLADEKNV